MWTESVLDEDERDSSITLDYMAAQRRRLANEQARLEERVKLRMATAEEFDQMRRQRLESCRKAFMHEAAQARDRNRQLLDSLKKTKENFDKQSCTPIQSVLSKEKLKFLSKVEKSYPTYQKEAMQRAVGRVHQLERERLATMNRMQAAQQAFEQEQAMKHLIEQTRQNLTMTQIMEHNEEVRRQLRREKLSQQVAETDEVMFAEAMRVMNAARAETAHTSSDGRQQMAESIRNKFLDGMGISPQQGKEDSTQGDNYFYNFDFAQLAPERKALEASSRAHAQWLREQVTLEASTLAINDPSVQPASITPDQPPHILAGVQSLRHAQEYANLMSPTQMMNNISRQKPDRPMASQQYSSAAFGEPAPMVLNAGSMNQTDRQVAPPHYEAAGYGESKYQPPQQAPHPYPHPGAAPMPQPPQQVFSTAPSYQQPQPPPQPQQPFPPPNAVPPGPAGALVPERPHYPPAQPDQNPYSTGFPPQSHSMQTITSTPTMSDVKPSLPTQQAVQAVPESTPSQKNTPRSSECSQQQPYPPNQVTQPASQPEPPPPTSPASSPKPGEAVPSIPVSADSSVKAEEKSISTGSEPSSGIAPGSSIASSSGPEEVQQLPKQESAKDKKVDQVEDSKIPGPEKGNAAQPNQTPEQKALNEPEEPKSKDLVVDTTINPKAEKDASPIPPPLTVEDSESDSEDEFGEKKEEKKEPPPESPKEPSPMESLVDTIQPSEQVILARKVTATILSRAEKSRTERGGYRLGYAKGRNLPIPSKNIVVKSCLENKGKQLATLGEDLLCEVYVDLVVRRAGDILPMELLNGKVSEDKVKKHHKKFKKDRAGELWDIFALHLQKMVDARVMKPKDVPKVFSGLFLDEKTISQADIARYQRKMETFLQKLSSGDVGTPVSTPKTPAFTSPLPGVGDSGDFSAGGSGRPPLKSGLSLRGSADTVGNSGGSLGILGAKKKPQLGGLIMGGGAGKKKKGGLDLSSMMGGFSAALEEDEFDEDISNDFDALEGSSFGVNVSKPRDREKSSVNTRPSTANSQMTNEDLDDEFDF